MTKIIIAGLMIASLALAGCGGFNRSVAHFTGSSKMCVDGVTYIQFTSGATVQVDRSGKPVPC